LKPTAHLYEGMAGRNPESAPSFVKDVWEDLKPTTHLYEEMAGRNPQSAPSFVKDVWGGFETDGASL
jgi:hypothetical protein